MAKKRERLEIIKDILRVVRERRKIKPTRLLHSSNLSPQMFKEYITELEENGMLDKSNSGEFNITMKGNEFLLEYEEIEKIIRNFGL